MTRRRKSMKIREETKRYLNNALNELSDPGTIGHYMRCNRYASMLEEAFGVKGPVELTEAIFDLLDQMPEGFTWATSKDGRPVALGSRVWLGDREMRVVAVSHRGRIAIREWTKERGRGAFWVPADKVTVEEPDTQERIDADALKPFREYWGCTEKLCYECPAKIDGKRPVEYYDTLGCGYAKILNLLRRQLELDARVVER